MTDYGLYEYTASRLKSSIDAISYSAPELVSPSGGGVVVPDESRDMWSMGILLIELMTARKAWSRTKNAIELKKMISNFISSSFGKIKKKKI